MYPSRAFNNFKAPILLFGKFYVARKKRSLDFVAQKLCKVRSGCDSVLFANLQTSLVVVYSTIPSIAVNK